MSDTDPLIERAIQVVGKQSDLAKAIGCAQQTVSKLLHREIPISAEAAVAIHDATFGKVSRAELRPDLFGHRGTSEPAASVAAE